ncbi:zinc transporter 10 [Triplophysa dalaica]|uniref:zinc transporter 10 n=1 Tax=Triplophysa dalaica TaxID=1582913 RepID=UPI0024DF95A0|nr:zinc transporter 10 [Triplophysa dalaica]XP_056617451.1 zinc transporter 10 [Triplophysa dalaica]
MGRYSGKTCRLILMIVITVIFFVAEIVAGYVGNSIALVSDSFNMLSDILSLCVGLTAARVSRRAGSGRYTYGLGRAEVVGALANAVFLAALCFSISMEALKRLARPEAIDDPLLVLIVGTLGLAVNVVGLLIFMDFRWLCGAKRQKDGKSADAEEEAGSLDHQSEEQKSADDGPPLNIRGVLLHVLNDALGSVVVVVASALFYVWPLAPESPCNWQCYVDPSLTLIMVAIIMSSAAPLVKETAGILLQMSPADLHLSSLLENVRKLSRVVSVHELHIWELSKGRNVATLHVKVSADLHEASWRTGISSLHREIREVFHYAGVHSVTVQFEHVDGGHCDTPCLSSSCVKLSCCPAGAASASVLHGNSASPSEDRIVDTLDVSNTLLRQKERKHAHNVCSASTKF